MSDTCADCRHLYAGQWCRRYPPVILPDETLGGFPRMDPSSWCGEYQAANPMVVNPFVEVSKMVADLVGPEEEKTKLVHAVTQRMGRVTMCDYEARALDALDTRHAVWWKEPDAHERVTCEECRRQVRAAFRQTWKSGSTAKEDAVQGLRETLEKKAKEREA